MITGIDRKHTVIWKYGSTGKLGPCDQVRAQEQRCYDRYLENVTKLILSEPDMGHDSLLNS